MIPDAHLLLFRRCEHVFMKNFTDLDAWKYGLELMKEIYVLTRKFPREERFDLISQLRRSSKSILSNLAEGFGRYTFADKAGKFVIARGECAETEAGIHIAVELRYITDKEAEHAIQLARRVGQLLSGLIKATRSHDS
jgi:four helix bundle protein